MLSRLTGLSAILIVLVWLTGCVPKIVVPTRFDSQQLNPKLDKILEIDKMDCGMLREKKIFTSFTANMPSKEFLETIAFPEQKVKKYKYTGNLAEDIKKKLDSVLTNHCGAKIANTIDDSDIALNGAIEKFYSQILEYQKEGDESLAGWGEKQMNFKLRASTVMSIINKFGNSDNNWKYEHLLTLNINKNTKLKKSYYVVASKLHVLITFKNRLDYDDDITIALESGVISTSQTFSIIPIPLPPGIDEKLKIEIYDVNTRNLKEEIMLNKEDFDGLGRLKNPEKDIEGLYFSTPGNFKILIYNYVKEIISKLNVSMSNK